MEFMNNKFALINEIRNLAKNDYVSEIATNGPEAIFFKEKGKRKSIPSPFSSEEAYLEAIDGLIEDAGLIKNKYLVEGRYNLPGGKFGRLHIIMPPASPIPLVTLAIKTQTLTSLTSIQAVGSFNTEISMFLKAAVGSNLTTCISGGTGAGKTTLLEAMASEFKHTERIGVCEDSPELQLDTPNTVYLNSTVWVPGMKDSDVADLSWVVKQINRMRVDKIVIGETRGKEFFDFITAANSGAEGSMTTIHANDGPSAMKKMATFMYMAVDMSPRIINEMISQAVDIVIQLGKNKNGDHKILSIHEITNAISVGDSPTIALNPLFTYDEQSNTWVKKFATDALKKKFEAHGYNPNSYAIREIERREAQRGLPSYFKEGMD